MRDNIRKGLALGALAAVALVYPGCKSESPKPAAQNADSLMQSDREEGTGGSGEQTGMPSAAGDAGTGGSGSEAPGTKGQGVSGSESEQLESTGESPSGGVPAQ